MKIRIGNKDVVSFEKKVSKEIEEISEKVSEEKIDVLKLIKKNKAFVVLLLAVGVALLGFYIRTMNVPNLGNKVLALDPWVWYRYASEIVANGNLPQIDTMRYFPVGYVTSNDAIIIPYVMAYAYKFLSLIIPGLSVMTVVQYYPAVATFFGTIFFFLFVSKVFNSKVGLLAALTLVLIPGFLFRTIAGFSDKESLGMFFFFAALYFFARSIKSKSFKEASVNSGVSGVLTALMGMTWGGWIFLLYSFAAYTLFQVLSDNVNKKSVFIQLSWIIPIFLSDFFTNRYNILKVLAFNTVLLGFAATLVRIYLVPILDKKIKDFNKIPLGISSIVIAAILGFIGATIVLSPTYTINTIKSVTVLITDPLGGDNAMGQSVSENQQPYFDPDWKSGLGFYYSILALAGSVLLMFDAFRKVYDNNLEPLLKFALPFGIFLIILVLSRYKVGDAITSNFDHLYQPSYVILIGWYALIFINDWVKGKNFNKTGKLDIFVILLFTLLAIAARGAVRLIFAFAPLLTITGSYLFVRMYELIRDNLKDKFYRTVAYICIGAIVFFLVLSPVNVSAGSFQLTSFYNQVTAMAPNFGPSIYGDWDQGFQWIKDNTPENAIFVHWWDYGYWLQSVANRTTVTDGGNARADWNYLMGRHLFGGSSLTEVHDVLRELGSPDYFYVVSDDVGKFYQMERIGERNTYYNLLFVQSVEDNKLPGINSTEFPKMIVYSVSGGAVVLKEDFTVNGKLFAQGQTYVTSVFVPYSENGSIGNPLAGVYNTAYGQALLPINGFCSENNGCYNVGSNGVPAYFYPVKNGAIWVPLKAGPMFMTQQYLLNKTIPGFELAWESSAPLDDMRTMASSRENVRVYKIDYASMEKAISEGYSWS